MTTLPEFIDSLPLSEPRPCPDGISPEEKLAQWRKQNLTDSDRSLLRRFLRKGEVGRRIYRAYDKDMAEPVSQEPLATPYITLMLALALREAETRRDYRFLNSVLKLADGLLAEPPYSPPQFIKDYAETLVETVRLHEEN